MTIRHVSVAVMVACVSLGLSAQAQAQAPQVNLNTSQPPIYSRWQTNFIRKHDRGLYARLEVGPSWRDMRQSEQEPSRGLVASYSVLVGGFIAEGLALGLSSWGAPGRLEGGLSAGPGVTFYPDSMGNLSLSVNAGAMSFYGAQTSMFEDWALAAEASIAKAWWLGPDAALGLSAYMGGQHFDLDRDGNLISGWQAGLRLVWSYQ